MKIKSWIAIVATLLCLITLSAWGLIWGQPVIHAASVPIISSVTQEYDCTAQSQIPQSECQALVIFYNQTNGPGWQNNDGWLVSLTPCTWSGITCAGGHVTVLNKNGGGDAGPRLEGTIPPELSNLTELITLDLRDNELDGPIPPSLGSLSKLQTLELIDNNLTGSIPPELGNLTSLVNLHLRANELTGNLPVSLGNLANLKRFDVNGNQLSGALPSQLGNLSNLEFMFIDYNNFFGNIPASFGNLSKLIWLRASENPLMAGQLPAALTAIPVPALKEFWITGTQMCAPNDLAFNNWWNQIQYHYGDVCNLDLAAGPLEVIQSIQDMNHSVRLVTNKRTFVRFYATSNVGNHLTNATLFVERGGQSTTVYALSRIVRQNYSRDILDQSFLFELPAGFREGQVKLTASLNPYKVPGEASYANNTSAPLTVNFEVVPVPNVVINVVTYDIGTTEHVTPRADAYMMLDWVTRAFPVPGVQGWVNNYDWNAVTGDDDGLPTCERLNGLMALGKLFEAIFIGNYPSNTRFYGLITDTGGFARGLATDIPGAVACGPTGVPGNPNSAGASNGGWDTDGTYGDWYGAHELAHAYGRSHVRGVVPSLGNGQCGGEAGVDASYPHANGNISSATTGDTALFGYDSKRNVLLPPTWTDVMTYCRREWISDYTFEGLMSFFQGDTAVAASLPQQGEGDRLLVAGSIDPVTTYVDLLPLYIIPNAGDVEPRLPGDYAIVLRNAEGDELARYPFTPDHADAGPAGQSQPNAAESHDNSALMISELVPFVAGTRQVQIVGPGNVVLKSVNASANAPVVTITSPNGGETLDGNSITVSWTASDTDGDTLSFVVQYSDDNGATWMVVAPNVRGNSVELPAENIPGSAQALFRVWASDGLNSASDSSDASFVVPNRVPTIEITSPAATGTYVASGQTLYLDAIAYDVESGMMPADKVQWASDVDGVLGQGAQLPIALLTTGLHNLTVTANDGAGGIVSASVPVTVVFTVADLPAVADALQSSQSAIHFIPESNYISETVFIQNQNANNPDPLRWLATSSEEWVQLSAVTGSVPSALTLTYNVAALSKAATVAEVMTATVSLTSVDIPGQTLELIVTVGEPDGPPVTPDLLQVASTQVNFVPATGQTSRSLTIDNQNSQFIRWNASSSEAWVTLSKPSGFTGDVLTLTFNDTGLAEGTHTATVALTSPDVPGQTLNITVNVEIGAEGVPPLFLPGIKLRD